MSEHTKGPPDDFGLHYPVLPNPCAHCERERDELIEALRPLAAERLSTEPTVSDTMAIGVATILRIQAGNIERRDGEIRRARTLLARYPKATNA